MENELTKPQIHANSLRKCAIVYLLAFLFAFPVVAQKLDREPVIHSKQAKKNFRNAEKALSANKFKEAENLLNLAIKQHHSYAQAWLLLADLYVITDRKLKAIDAYSQAIHIDSSIFPPAYGTLGNLLLNEGRYEEAAANYAVYLNSNLIKPEIKKLISKKFEAAKFGALSMKNAYPTLLHNLGKEINSIDDEYINSIRLDSEQLFFTRKNTVKSDSSNFGAHDERFFNSFYRASAWSKAHELDIPWKSIGNMGALCFSPDGNALYFSGCGWDGGFGSCDLYVSKRINNKWTMPENLGNKINSTSWESQPCISIDGKELYFASSRSGGKGGSDIWKSVLLADNTWGKPINLGAEINSSDNEMAPFIHPDGKTLYFSSNGHIGLGGFDIFMCKNDISGRWGMPENIGAPFNTLADEINLVVDATGKTGYISSKRAPGLGGFDIFTFEMPQQLRPSAVSYVRAFVFDAVTLHPLMANYTLKQLNNGNLISDGITSGDDGSCLIPLVLGFDYSIHFVKEGYLFHSENFSLATVASSEPYIIQVGLNKIESDKAIVLKNVFFEWNKSQLKPESNDELIMLALLLKKSMHLTIELGGHTDQTGTEQWNEKLSLARAQAVKQFLIDQGIEKNRITAIGFGSKKPIAPNTNELGRAQNRRTEMRIVSAEKQISN